MGTRMNTGLASRANRPVLARYPKPGESPAVSSPEVNVARLLRGLERLRVVSIGLDDKEDPQQIFESLNATGRPLTESEKVKNWLLMGLPDAEQQDLHDNHWAPHRAFPGRLAFDRTH